jgi:hypothetical protein
MGLSGIMCISFGRIRRASAMRSRVPVGCHAAGVSTLLLEAIGNPGFLEFLYPFLQIAYPFEQRFRAVIRAGALIVDGIHGTS